MSAASESSSGALGRAPSRTILALAVAAGLVMVAVASPASVVVVVAHLPPAALIVLAGLGLGLFPSRFMLPRAAPVEWHLVGGAGIGLGILSLLMLALGSAGVMNRPVWLVILALLAAFGLLRTLRLVRQGQGPREPVDAFRWFWMLLVPFAAIAILAASLPPGILWPAEGNGYDVLEYHLGAPREFFEAGRISFLPHNIYSNFPFAVEMLYLLSMIVHGDPVAAGITAHMVNLLIAGLAVAAVWLAGRQVGRPVGIIAAALAGTCPFVAYLCGVAYVENGLLLFTALTLAAVLRLSTDDDQSQPRWALVAGLFCGFACGCKYTGVVMVLLPIAAVIVIRLMRRPKAAASLAAFVVAVLVAFGPWLVRNYINTGNPVFPMARSIIADNGLAWNDDGATRWAEGHLPAPDDRSVTGRFRRLGTEVVASALFGPLIGLALVVGFIQVFRVIARRQSATALDLPAWMMIVVGIIIWLFFSHLVDRFAVTLIVPASLIVAAAWDSLRKGELRLVGIGVILLAAVFNLSMLLRTGATAGLFEVAALRTGDNADWFTGGAWPTHAHVSKINKLTANGNRVLVVADARRYYLGAGADYHVVFNRNPFAEAAAERSPAELIDWLREHEYDFVYVDWSEMARLRNSRYGFWKSIDRGLFERLMAAGLRPVEDFTVGENAGVYSTLFEVPRKNPPS